MFGAARGIFFLWWVVFFWWFLRVNLTKTSGKSLICITKTDSLGFCELLLLYGGTYAL